MPNQRGFVRKLSHKGVTINLDAKINPEENQSKKVPRKTWTHFKGN